MLLLIANVAAFLLECVYYHYRHIFSLVITWL